MPLTPMAGRAANEGRAHNVSKNKRLLDEAIAEAQAQDRARVAALKAESAKRLFDESKAKGAAYDAKCAREDSQRKRPLGLRRPYLWYLLIVIIIGLAVVVWSAINYGKPLYNAIARHHLSRSDYSATPEQSGDVCSLSRKNESIARRTLFCPDGTSECSPAPIFENVSDRYTVTRKRFRAVTRRLTVDPHYIQFADFEMVQETISQMEKSTDTLLAKITIEGTARQHMYREALAVMDTASLKLGSCMNGDSEFRSLIAKQFMADIVSIWHTYHNAADTAIGRMHRALRMIGLTWVHIPGAFGSKSPGAGKHVSRSWKNWVWNKTKSSAVDPYFEELDSMHADKDRVVPWVQKDQRALERRRQRLEHVRRELEEIQKEVNDVDPQERDDPKAGYSDLVRRVEKLIASADEIYPDEDLGNGPCDQDGML